MLHTGQRERGLTKNVQRNWQAAGCSAAVANPGQEDLSDQSSSSFSPRSVWWEDRVWITGVREWCCGEDLRAELSNPNTAAKHEDFRRL